MNIEHLLTGDKVQRWVAESLRDPLALSFSRYVADYVDLEASQFRVLVDSERTEEQVWDFEFGGKVSDDPPASQWLLESLEKIRSPEESFVFCEDWTARPAHLIASRSPMPAVFRDEEVYYVVQDRPLNHARKWRRAISNSVPLFHGFLVQGHPMPSLGSVLDEEQLKAIARHTQMAFLGVYDGESYLLCSFPKGK